MCNLSTTAKNHHKTNSSSTIRAFIALELPPAIISSLAHLQERFKASGLRAKWVRPESIHLTLKFLGNIAPGDIDHIGGSMTDAVKDCDPLTLAVRGVGVFPGVKRPRIIWAGLGGQTRQLFALQCRLEDNLAALGFAKEARPFKGHLTLGRFRHAPDPCALSAGLQEHANLSSEEFSANCIILFQSDLKPTGPVYSKLRQADFK